MKRQVHAKYYILKTVCLNEKEGERERYGVGERVEERERVVNVIKLLCRKFGKYRLPIWWNSKNR